MPKRSCRRRRHTQEHAQQGIAASPAAAQVRRQRPAQRSWFSRSRPSIITYEVVGLIAVGVLALVVSAVRQSFGSDFEFTMYQGDVGVPTENAQFSDLFPAEKPVVLNFWAGLCPPCRAEMPGFQRVYDDYEDRITLLGLDVGPFMNLGSRRDAERLLNELNITYPTGYAHSRDPVAQFGVSSMPTTIFFTPDGEVFRTAIGFLDESRMERNIQNLLTASATS